MWKKPALFGLTLMMIYSALPAWAEYSRFLNRNMTFCGEAVPMDDDVVFQSVDQSLVLLAEAKSRVWLTLRRAGRYKAVVAEELQKAGVPSDMIYIPYAITGFAPEYNSGGRGFWRLKDAEAKSLGLRVDANVDERLDPKASTAAVARNLKNFKASYGSWTTAMAAHLLGDGVVRQAVAEAGGESNFFRLYLPEGLDQLPATVLAGKALFQDPGSFGYNQGSDRGWPPFSGRPEVIKEATTIRALADKYKKDYKAFRDLNPHLLAGVAPAGVTVYLP